LSGGGLKCLFFLHTLIAYPMVNTDKTPSKYRKHRTSSNYFITMALINVGYGWRCPVPLKVRLGIWGIEPVQCLPDIGGDSFEL
jgi:hypothetical protein